MSISTELSRIQGARDTLRTKAVELKISAGTEKLDELAQDYNDIVNQGQIQAQVKEGETYTIPKGYHDGTGTVSGVAGGGNYTLQSKSITPTKKPQQVTPDEGYYGLSDVSVEAIPAQYQDTSSVTATAADVLSGKVIVTSDGSVTPGEMVNNGAVDKTLDSATQSYTVPAGYHNGLGTVKILVEEKTATPTKLEQEITPTSGKVLSKVTVGAIPPEYVDTTGATADANEILEGETAFSGGKMITGAMPNNGSVKKTLDTTTTTTTIEKGYHDGTGSVSITLETKSATPTKSEQTITPTTGKVLSQVTVAAIPDQYIDTTQATAEAGDILLGETAFVGGVEVTGTMPNNGSVTDTLDAEKPSVTIAAGYHDGTGAINIVPETKSATPTKEAQNITPTTGKVLTKVTVAAIPPEYITTDDATAAATDILDGQTAYVAGSKVVGSMANNGAVNGSIDGLSTTSFVVQQGYTTGGTVTLTDDIEQALAAI